MSERKHKEIGLRGVVIIVIVLAFLGILIVDPFSFNPDEQKASEKLIEDKLEN